MEDRMQASSFLPLLYFPSLALFSWCIAVFLFPSTFCLSSHPIPYIFSPPLTLLPLCLTAVGLLWEVIRKNSTETHTQQLLKTRLSILSTLPSCITIAQGWESGEGGVCRYYQDIFREWCRGGKGCFGKPKLLCAKVSDARFKLLEPACFT